MGREEAIPTTTIVPVEGQVTAGGVVVSVALAASIVWLISGALRRRRPAGPPAGPTAGAIG